MYLGNHPSNPNQIINGAILNIAKLIKNVMASAAEAELGALYMCGQEAVPLRTTLIELGHPQPPTPIRTDNSTACAIANATCKQRRSKSIDMRFYWLRDRVEQGQFNIYWAPGTTNLADYFTKHHAAAHHHRQRDVYLHTPNSPTDLRGCIELGLAPRARPAH